MFRVEFINLVTASGMVGLKELRDLTSNKDPDVVSELGLLENDKFDFLKFAQVMSKKFQLPYLDLKKAKVNSNEIKSVNHTLIVKYRSIPIIQNNGVITFAIFDPSIAINSKEDLALQSKSKVKFILTDLSSWNHLFQNLEKKASDILTKIQEVKPSDEKEKNIKEEDIGEEVIDLVNSVLAEAYVKKVSDIHIEPYEKKFRIRFRLDGTLSDAFDPPQNLMAAIISRIKIMAQMDIAEKRKPQDGRIKLLIAGEPIDYRVSSLPCLFGEKIVLRLLDQSNLQLDMTKLGFEQNQLSKLKEGIHCPYGMCLVTGPTGSGKTTTLYSALAELNKPEVNISTAEDPVEFNLEGINQVNVRKDIGFTFAAALKSFLRQDPDIIMVGEIRDLETGEIAVEAALTGHMVLSTLHTNDAPSTVTRLLNMGIEPFLITGALNVVVAQRLCKRICSQCRVVDESISTDTLVSLGITEGSAKKIKMYKGKGCETCGGTGMKGRVAIYEVLVMSVALKELVLRNASAEDIKKQAVKEGMKTLRMSALTKAAQGLTTIQEAVSNSASDK